MFDFFKKFLKKRKKIVGDMSPIVAGREVTSSLQGDLKRIYSALIDLRKAIDDNTRLLKKHHSLIASLIATKPSFEPSELDNKILRMLRKGRLRAVEVARKLRISRQHASERLSKLVEHGLVRRVRIGSKIYYEIAR